MLTMLKEEFELWPVSVGVGAGIGCEEISGDEMPDIISDEYEGF